MSSSRAMRKSSRMSSPFVTAPKDSSTSENDSHVQKEKEKASEPGEWSEPALRAPVPSFEDHKGLERHGVLEHMAPLGSLPSQKVKLRVKSHEAPRRMVQSKLAMDSNSGKDVAKAPLDTTVTTRRSESRKADDTIIDPTFDRDDDEDYKEKPVKQSRASKSKEPRPSVNSTPTSRTSAGQERLRQVVDSAVERAYELGTPILGLAVKKLFEESLQNRTLAELLDAVLSQRPTPRQALDFQAYIKIARKQIKIDNGMTRHSSVGGLASSSKSSSKSPVKSMRPANTGQSGTTPNDKSDRPASNTPTRTFPDTSRPPQHHSHPEASNGTMETNKERPAKRMKRSKSTSSSSSLSSLTSNEPDVDSDLPDPPSSARVGKSKAQASHSRKLPTKVSRKRLHVEVEPEVAPEELAKRRKKFERSFGDYRIPESDLRQSPRPVPRERSISVSPTFPSLAQPSSRLRNGTGRVAPASDHDNSHTQVSPGPGEQPPPGRSDTPNALGRPPKRIQKAARIKMSPMKKKNGVIAGIARAGGGRDSSVGYGHGDEIEDNENVDYCTACSGNGQLLCCDGCTRSFHFTCLDPPMDPSQPPEGEWFCYICKARRDPQPKRGRGLFADLLTNLDKKNPIAFNLPYEVREYFEGVKTGEEGEYEEATTSKSRSRIGHDEVPDYFKLKDSKGNCVLCFRCGKSAMGRREIIACDFCNLQWHIDCLDPPLANPPPRGSNGKPRHDWMCPNHIDDELQAFDTSVRISRRSQAGIGGSRKVRRPKNARIIDTALRRGFVNNGNIEIQNEPFDVDKFIEREEFGVVYRVPERGVKLDFIDRVRRSHVEAQHALAQVGAQNAGNYAPAASPIVASAEAHQEAFHKRPFADRQVALNLAQMAHSNEELSVSTDQIENLVSALIAEAPTAVVDMFSTHGENTTSCDDDITTTNPTILPTPQKPQESDLSEKGISAAEKQQLLVIQELIRRRLGPAVKAES